LAESLLRATERKGIQERAAADAEREQEQKLSCPLKLPRVMVPAALGIGIVRCGR
jgi:hypothetical protein